MSVIAPAAPGRLGEPADPLRFLAYLDGLGGWIAGRRDELGELDAAARASDHAAELTGDIRLGLALWQAIKSRHDLMLAVWDSGRVGPAEADRLSSLVWGRLDTAPGADAALSAMSVSIPEATRLSDALTAQLRQRLQLDPSGSQVTARLRDLRAQIERLRDQVALEPAGAQHEARRRVAELDARVRSAADKAGRGGDVGGLLGPIEIEAATYERDLIVGGVTRRQSRGAGRAAEQLREELRAREPGLRDLVARAVALVAPAPKYAVPVVDALGPVPSDAAGIEAYRGRLARVARAMDVVEEAYAQAIADHDALRATLAALKASPAASDPTLATMLASAEKAVTARPSQVAVARPLVSACREYAAQLPGARGSS